jgi:hypothetical protein
MAIGTVIEIADQLERRRDDLERSYVVVAPVVDRLAGR